ncbi:MAG: hypothetical protein OXI63_26210 [Candidatus Poribacteria bacterium]|nr:hypothetical protein [Candidatus Poribacteria bacterium]
MIPNALKNRAISLENDKNRDTPWNMLTFSQVLSHVFDKNQLSFHPQSKRGGIAENICLGDFRRQKHRDTQTLHLIDENPITLTDTCPSRDIIRQGLRFQET